MDFKEFIKIARDIESQRVYEIFCHECITYVTETGAEGTIRGLIGGRTQEFNTQKKAKSAIALHANQNPLHKPYLDKQVQTEYILRDQRHMTRYRRSGEYVHVYSVDGFKIACDKHAYECLECGAIYQSKDTSCRRVFPTTDLRCQKEVHERTLSSRICLCPTIWEDEKMEEDKLLDQGCVFCQRKLLIDAEGFPLVTLVSDPDIGAYVCAICWCHRKGKHEWIYWPCPKTGKDVPVFCNICNLKHSRFNEIARTKKGSCLRHNTKFRENEDALPRKMEFNKRKMHNARTNGE